MSGFEERKIGGITFLVFADGMVPANDVAQLTRKGDRLTVRFKRSGWVDWFKVIPDPSDPA